MSSNAILRLNAIVQHLQSLPSVNDRYTITKNNLEDIVAGVLALITETDAALKAKNRTQLRSWRHERAKANATITKLRTEVARLKEKGMNIEEGLETLAARFHDKLILVEGGLEGMPVACPHCRGANRSSSITDIVDYRSAGEDYTLVRCNTCGEYFAIHQQRS